MKNSDVFLESFSSIEKHLRSITGATRRVSFYELLNGASQKSPVVRRLITDLKEYADLRNAIVHERTDGHVIAEPNEAAVNDLKLIKELVIAPPRVIPTFQKHVTSLDESVSIGEAVTVMREHAFSQVPVTAANKFIGLLTSNTIARWLASQVEDEILSLKENQISEVLKHTEDPDNYAFLRRNADVFQAMEQFDLFENRGKRLEAVLITQNGEATESFLGVITLYDVPRLLDQMGNRRSGSTT